jgi:hypothetical protein
MLLDKTGTRRGGNTIRILYSTAVRSRTSQTEVEAEALVIEVIKEQLRRLGEQRLWDLVSGFNARDKLIYCLLWWNDESEWRDFLERVPALVDGGLIASMALMMAQMAASGDPVGLRRELSRTV